MTTEFLILSNFWRILIKILVANRLDDYEILC